jgi:hypothetical protein
MTATPILCVGPDNIQGGQHRRWHSARPATLRVLQGRLWVTVAERPDDHFVDAGMSLELPAHADVLIGAERDASLRLETAPRATVAHKAWPSPRCTAAA